MIVVSWMSAEEKDGEIAAIRKRIEKLEKDLTLLANEQHQEESPYMEVKGDFFQVMAALRSLYLESEGDMEEIKRISSDIESGNIKVDMTELFFRFFVRQEIQNARLKLLLLSQKFDVKGELFDTLDDLQVLIDHPRYSVHQVILGWKRFERDVAKEIKRLRKS